MDKKVLSRQAKGAIKTVLVCHGKVTKDSIGSLAKRIVGQMSKYELSYPDEPLKEKLINWISLQQHKLHARRQILKKIQDPAEIARFKAKNKELSLLLIDLKGFTGLKFGRLINPMDEKSTDQKKIVNVLESKH